MSSKRQPRSNAARICTLVSGKGGVGRTNLAANLAVALAQRHKRVLLFDADLSLANVDVLLGLVPKLTVQHALTGVCAFKDTLLPGPCGITLLPASSGVPELVQLDAERMEWLCAQVAECAQDFDLALIDAPSGIGTTMQRFAALADELLLVTVPEPTAVMDAYAVSRLLTRRVTPAPLKLIVNMVCDQETGDRASSGLQDVLAHFLRRQIEPAAQVPFDAAVPLAVRQQQPFVLCYPDCPATAAVRCIAADLAGDTTEADIVTENAAGCAGGFEGLPVRNRITPWLDQLKGWKPL